MAAGHKSVSELLREVANRLDCTSSPQSERVLQQHTGDEAVPGPSSHQNSTMLTSANANAITASSTPRNAVQAEVARLFAPYRVRPSSAPLSSLTSHSSKKACRSIYTHTFFCLHDHMSDTVPAKAVKFDLAAAGLGEKRISFQGRDDDPEVVKAKIEDTFPQLKDTGGFELLRISGTTRSRNLCTIPSPDTGYTVRYLRSPLSGIGQALIYIRPLQKSIDLEDSLTTLQQQGPPTKCLNCDINIPLNKMKNHITKCTSSLSGAEPQSVTESQARQTRSTTARSEVPSCSNSDAWNLSCGVEEPDSIILESTITSARAEQSSGDMVVVQEDASHQDEEKSLLGEKPEWKCEQDATRAAWLYKSELLSKYETRKAVVLQMDLRESIVDQQRSLISLYKAPKVEWAGPVSCKLEGDVAVGEGVKRFFFSKAVSLVQSGLHLNFGNTDLTRLFDGEPEHLTPSTSQTLLESDMFLVAA
ncbi:uncharacterized protein LOC120737779 isoform X2 [Simochromis diagramma]|uniref:uncharacterized protein LOC120737779 isoform X2 n=1 Tax=Simochromis diagramma TaxID=43689 RepID=UPI001A7EFE52|nr:uncharacterized protein LOC120737779 isoform X2 [Simochromis diagramma]